MCDLIRRVAQSDVRDVLQAVPELLHPLKCLGVQPALQNF